MEKESTETLQDLARSAKQRMKQGYWKSIIEARRKDVDEAANQGKDTNAVITYYKDKVLKDFYVSRRRVDEEDRVYSMVCDMMRSGEEMTNPLARLVDHSIYDGLDDDGRMRYMFELSSLYIRMKRRYKKEHEN